MGRFKKLSVVFLVIGGFSGFTTNWSAHKVSSAWETDLDYFK